MKATKDQLNFGHDAEIKKLLEADGRRNITQQRR